MPEEKIGSVTHFFKKPMVAALELTGELRVGDRVHFHGHTTDFDQTIESMQIEHQGVESAGAGDAVGVQVAEYVRVGDTVYKVISEAEPG
jgi:putative protease